MKWNEWSSPHELVGLTVMFKSQNICEHGMILKGSLFQVHAVSEFLTFVRPSGPCILGINGAGCGYMD